MNKKAKKYILDNGRYKPTKEYRAWDNMKSRCLNKKAKNYEDYGGRGIGICEKWVTDFNNFFDDMGRAPSPKHSLGRINNNEGYCKKNCRWETPIQQAGNKRNTIYVSYKGNKIPLGDYARLVGISHQRALNAYNKGWDMNKYEKAITV